MLCLSSAVSGTFRCIGLETGDGNARFADMLLVGRKERRPVSMVVLSLELGWSDVLSGLIDDGYDII